MLLDTLLIYSKWLNTILKSNLSLGKKKPAGTNTKTLFIVASHLPPNSGGGVFRALSFIRYAIENNWSTKAFSLDYKIENQDAGNFLIRQIQDPTCLERIELNRLKPSWSLTPRIDGGFNNCLNMFGHVIRTSATRPDMILSTGPSFHTFLTGFYLSKYYQCKLTLDYRDEWTLCPFSWVEKDQLNRFFEKICCRHASKIIFTTQSHLDNHTKHFPDIDPDKKVVISNGYEDGDLSVLPFNQATPTHAFTLSFIGNLTAHSLPNHFLHDLEKIFSKYPDLADKIDLVFAGNKSKDAIEAINSFPYKKSVISLDHMPKNQALELMHRSDALLILAGEGMKSYIPGKLFDYVAAKKPILYFGEQGEVTSIINQLGIGFSVAPGNIDTLGAHLLCLLRKEFSIDDDAVKEWLKSHTRRALAKKLFNELDSLLEARNQ
jgi:glycosyltransferase involved in cell wall biosynthesis